MTAPFHPERPADEDAFNRRKFAENLARGIAAPHGDGGLVVAIEGEWGSGKSSILRWVVEALEKLEPAPLVIQFNPWRISGQDTLTETFLTLLAAQIGGESNSSNAEKGAAASERILGYLKLLRHLKYLKYLPGTGWAGQASEDAAAYVEKSTQAGDAFVDDVRNSLAKDKGIEGLRDGIDEALNELGREVVVVMDDLDRLTRDEIRTVFQLLKAVADFSHITYLLAFDPDRVALSLADNGDKEEGRAFLEKIVQLAYPIPPLFPWQAFRFAQSNLEQTLTETAREWMPFEEAIWDMALELVAKLARHPRDIARLCNRLRISLPATAGAVNACDVIVYEALSQRFPDLATAIRIHPNEFTRNRFSSSHIGIELDIDDIVDSKTASKRWERHLPEGQGNRQLAMEACGFLFPQTQQQKDIESTAYWRISDTEILARLLQGTSLEGIADAKEFHRIMANPSELGVMMNTLDPESLHNWISYAMLYATAMRLPDPRATLKILAQQCTKRIHDKAAHSEFCRSFSTLAKSTITSIEVEDEDRAALLTHLVEVAPLSMSHDVLLDAAAEHGLWLLKPDEEQPAQDRFIQDGATVVACISQWNTKAQQALDDGTLIEEPLLHSILYRWGQLGDMHHYAPAWIAVEKLCESEAGLRRFLSTYTNRECLLDSPDIWLIRNPDALLARIDQYPDLKQTHSKFIAKLSDPIARQELDAFIKSQEQ